MFLSLLERMFVEHQSYLCMTPVFTHMVQANSVISLRTYDGWRLQTVLGCVLANIFLSKQTRKGIHFKHSSQRLEPETLCQDKKHQNSCLRC